MQEDVWFLLYSGHSPDGLGPCTYCGRTTDPAVAVQHYRKIRADAYNTGKVVAFTDTYSTMLAPNIKERELRALGIESLA